MHVPAAQDSKDSKDATAAAQLQSEEPLFHVGPNGLIGGAHFSAMPFLQALFEAIWARDPNARMHIEHMRMRERYCLNANEQWTSDEILRCVTTALQLAPDLAQEEKSRAALVLD